MTEPCRLESKPEIGVGEVDCVSAMTVFGSGFGAELIGVDEIIAAGSGR